MFDLGRKTKKAFLITSLTFFLVANFFIYSLLRPAPVYAGIPVTVVGSIPSEKDAIMDQIMDSLLAAALGSLVNGASYFMRKFAYDSAKYIASGGSGQGALAFKDGFGSYMENTALDSVAGAIDQFGAPFGLSLCKPPDLRIQVNIQVSLSQIYSSEASGGKSGPQPRCKWNDLKTNWSKDNLESMYGSKDALSERFSSSLSVTEGDFGTALGLMGKLDRIQAKAEAAAQAVREEGQGYKSVTNLISGKVKTPAQVIKKETEVVTGGKQMDMSATQIAGIYGAGAWQILPMAASVFANTLVSTLLQDIMTNGLFPDDSEGKSISDFYAGSINYNRRAAESAFSYLTAGIPQHDLESYEITTVYSSCPDNPGLNNCVMDADLVQALQRARIGDPITIGEALETEGGLLHSTWKLIPPSRAAENVDKNCYNNNYCYSNIQKLRKARILPLGFEIAALRSDPDSPDTLGEVVSRFDDPTSDFYHLIDPNWILKVPEAQCEAEVDGPQLRSENSDLRAEECVDFSTCLSTGDEGCKAFGYCTQEKNIWKLPGQTCPEYYNTCKTYTGPNNTVTSYLSRTVDQGSCNAESVGCRAYSTEKVDGEWVRSSEVDLSLKTSGREQVMYYNDQINAETCPEDQEGCSMFLHASTTKPLFLKKAPEYLGCYDIDPDTQNILEWPQTRADMVLLQDAPEECNNFAGVCIPEETGCEEYTPVNGDNLVTGIVGDNRCPVSCVGYETFKQEATPFESKKFPLYFVPSHGEQCAPQYDGCDEFTNISAGEIGEGGEQLEYYTDIKYCERPDGDNAKTYYTWEGSESTGYVLKKHSLLQIDSTESSYISALGLTLDDGTAINTIVSFPAGSPAYATDNPTELTQKYEDCNQDAYNILLDNYLAGGAALSGCYALYDSSGSVYYRMIDDTVTVSNKCVPLRKTESEMFVDDNFTLNSETKCEEKGGLWEAGECQRCMGGGFYQVDELSGIGSCVYWSIQEEATACISAANGCRRYIGNTGNNAYNVYNTSFEPNEHSTSSLIIAKEGWSGTVSVEPEATQVGLYSLKVGGSGSASYDLAPGKIRDNLWYELTFWSRGNPQLLAVTLEQAGSVNAEFTLDPLTTQQTYAAVTQDWQEYTLGPVQFDGSLDVTTTLKIASVQGSGIYFVDNVFLRNLGTASQDYEFLIKDSWKTDEGYDTTQACDSTPLDGFPGEHLGCRAYTTRANTPIQFSGFEKLCRAEAVGCTPLYDTQNYTEEEGGEKHIFNALCRKGSNGAASQEVCGTTVDLEFYSCTLSNGADSCFVEGPVTIPSNDYEIRESANFAIVAQAASVNTGIDNLYVVTSTVVVAEDSDVIYLTHTRDSICDQTGEYLGCQRVALEERVLPDESEGAYVFSERFIVNNPLDYEQTLCVEEQVGCNTYTYDGGNVSFFKDPKLSGAGLCNYEEEIMIDNVAFKGWFMDGVGVCEDEITDEPDGMLCRNADDCGEGKTCADVGKQACYPNYLTTENERGLWSNASVNYEGYVGVCGTQYGGCTELVDPADTSGYEEGKPYYVIYDDRLFSAGDCAGQASQKEGCVLFDKTENPDKYFNSVATYEESEKQKYASVDVILEGDRDTNELIKVRRDRECSEWLECRNAIQITNEAGIPQELCTEFKACSELDEKGDCAVDGWVSDAWENRDRLTYEKYTDREVGWSDFDYSGYSLFNKYAVSNYAYLLLFEDEDDAFVAYEMDNRFFVGEDVSLGCQETVGNDLVKEDGESCGFDVGGRCYKQKCLYPIGGVFNNEVSTSKDVNLRAMKNRLDKAICKAYPEENSPFPIYMAIQDPGSDEDKRIWYESGSTERQDVFRRDHIYKREGFERAQICQEGESGEDCSCEYIKIEYDEGTIDYWSRKDNPENVKGICDTGTRKGHPCATDLDCKTVDDPAASCSKIVEKGTYFGQKGLCLEYDLSRPLTGASSGDGLSGTYACLTWLPIKISASSFDLYNDDINAGYNPVIDANQTGGEVYCALASRGGYYYDQDKVDFDALSNDGAGVYQEYFDDDDTEELYAKWSSDCEPDPNLDDDSLDECYIYDSECVPVLLDGNNLLLEDVDGGVQNYGPAELEKSLVWIINENEYDCDLYPEGNRDLELYATQPEYGDNSFESVADDYVNSVVGGHESNGLYKAMQAWAWKEIGSNAVVLRVENRHREDHGALYRTDSNYKVNDKKVNSVFGLAPNPELRTEDGGTFMHPPRIWDDESHSGLKYFNRNHGHEMEKWGNADYASTVAYSPGPYLTEKG
ncbi:hypothetical protein C0581_04225 [Candidatus Parcubacteria bacterium]|nr:MAG: hypothetical protein C0581_04225 [Candidatus Parcubacteria bacterium]